MIATLVQIYVDRGLLGWRTRLDKVLPRFKNEIHAELRQVTIDMLTSHRSGVLKDVDPRDFENISAAKRHEKTIQTLLSFKPRYRPGSFVYCHANYVVLGTILESLTGQSLERLMATELFEPLEMASCGFSPTGAAYCSMEDYLKFAKAHIDGFRGRHTVVLPAASYRKLHEKAPSKILRMAGGTEKSLAGRHRRVFTSRGSTLATLPPPGSCRKASLL